MLLVCTASVQRRGKQSLEAPISTNIHGKPNESDEASSDVSGPLLADHLFLGLGGPQKDHFEQRHRLESTRGSAMTRERCYGSPGDSMLGCLHLSGLSHDTR